MGRLRKTPLVKKKQKVDLGSEEVEEGMNNKEKERNVFKEEKEKMKRMMDCI